MSSLLSKPDLVTQRTELLGEVVICALAAAAGQTLSHTILATDSQLPPTWEDLVIRYTAGSGINAALETIYALCRPDATARDALAVKYGILLACGVTVGLLHLGDFRRARAESRAANDAYDHEDRSHVASLISRLEIPQTRRHRP